MIKFLKYNIMTVALAASLTGCISDNADCPDGGGGEPSDSYVLRLAVAAGDQMSRASNHEGEDATPAENYIDVKNGDYTVLIYKTNGDLIEQVATPMVTYQGDDIYWVESELSRSALEGLDEFQVMVVANWKAYDGSPTYTDKFSGTSTSSTAATGIWKNTSDFNFSHQDYLTGGTTAWTPDIAAGRLIPMFGMQTVSKSDFSQDLSGVNRAMISVPMLRALAKIEVIDNTPAGYEITGVTLSRYNKQGRLIPDITLEGNASWNENSVQISNPSTIPNVTTGTGLRFSSRTNTDGKTVWTAYVAEDLFTEDLFTQTDLNDERPHLNVTVRSTQGHNYVYPVHFALYDSDGKPTIPTGAPEWNRLLRNHIYRYDITSASVTANLELNVLPWETTDDEIWFYEEIPGSVEPIEWDNFSEINKQKATVTLNVSQETEKILCGSFQISAPLSGIWHAQLMTMGNALPRAVTFCNADGSEIVSDEGQDGYHIWGPIGVRTPDGTSYEEPKEKAKIYIKVTSTGKQQESQFKLLIVVQNGENWMEMNLTPTEADDGVNYWTIIRPTTDYESGGD